MKANELMIGDWVIPHYEDIGDTPEQLSVELFKYKDTESFIEGFDPIPLTEEILKENGLIKDKEYGYFGEVYGVFHKYYGQQGFQIISGVISPNKEFELKLPEPIQYVHELQHVLRLCGLNELADSFKV